MSNKAGNLFRISDAVAIRLEVLPLVLLVAVFPLVVSLAPLGEDADSCGSSSRDKSAVQVGTHQYKSAVQVGTIQQYKWERCSSTSEKDAAVQIDVHLDKQWFSFFKSKS
jgi:hypothetical protein